MGTRVHYLPGTIHHRVIVFRERQLDTANSFVYRTEGNSLCTHRGLRTPLQRNNVRSATPWSATPRRAEAVGDEG